jgi:hypothetical protein
LTVPWWPLPEKQASAFIVFPDVRAACRAASILRDETAVDAVELFDRASLRRAGRLVRPPSRPGAIPICLALAEKGQMGRERRAPNNAKPLLCLPGLILTLQPTNQPTNKSTTARECEADEQMATLVPDILGADPMAAALLIECRGRDAEALQASIDEVRPPGALSGSTAGWPKLRGGFG